MDYRVKFLVPSGGFIDMDFGILATPHTRGVPNGIRAGMEWAADNGAYTNKFNPNKFFSWLNRFNDYKNTCLFIVCPDVVGDAKATLKLFDEYIDKFVGWPVAFVAQDGQEHLDFPDTNKWQTLFIGGSTEWKMSRGAINCIKRVQKLGKHIHIGRVNYIRRYQYFANLSGANDFTCDGTRLRYERTKTISEWKSYMNEWRK